MTARRRPPPRRLYLGHILGAEARGEALADLLPSGGQILEVGCGTGGLLAAAAASGLAIEGVDIALRWLVVARRRLDDRGLVGPAASRPRPSGCPSPTRASTRSWPTASSSTSTTRRRRSASGPECSGPAGRLLVWSPNRYALTVDPHVRLWGLGWLPRAWMPAYVRWRRGGAWPPPCLSVGEARRTGTRGRVSSRSRSIRRRSPMRWARSRPGPERRLISAYSDGAAIRRSPAACSGPSARSGSSGRRGGGWHDPLVASINPGLAAA